MDKFEEIEHLITDIHKMMHMRDNDHYLGKKSDLSADIASKKEQLKKLIKDDDV